jgi:Fe-S-cluster containining protein
MPQFDAEDLARARQWLEIARQPEVGQRLEAIYAMIADQVAARAPVCVASGRCCNFESYGHRLYVTGLEAAWCVAQLSPEAPTLSAATVADALERGGCPFQVGTLCGVHTIKPVGCRTYFCDPVAEGWQEGLTERAHGMVKDLHLKVGVPYRYMEWRAMLDLMASARLIETETQE